MISALAATGSALAQQPVARDSASAAICDVKYDVTFLQSNGARREVDVAMTFTTAGTSPVVLSLPAWTPRVRDLELRSGDRGLRGHTSVGDEPRACLGQARFRHVARSARRDPEGTGGSIGGR
jgi:hypothetical protein